MTMQLTTVPPVPDRSRLSRWLLPGRAGSARWQIHRPVSRTRRELAALDAEKNRTHATSAFDVMVGIQRVLEGTDWPVCSAVIIEK